jgi:predicted acylesterase/phospholipase RssA
MIGRLLSAVIFLMAVPAWTWFAGSYSVARDITGVVVTTIFFFALARRSKGDAGSHRSAIRAMLRPSFAFTWMLACWVAISTMDRIFVSPPVALNGNVTAPPSIRADLTNKRIAVALSGGGYRAALLHAGVVMQLNELGVPVTNIVSVSGGSILGGFLAAGGDPADFVKAVRDGRFRLMRELTSAYQLPRWVIPFTGYTRRDVQAALLRRTLLPEKLDLDRGPEVMIAMTDLAHVMSVGWTRDGLMFAGPTTSRFYRWGDVLEANGFGDLADIVAVSGAFPGAFPTKPVSVTFSRLGLPLSDGADVVTMDLALSDGGVRDNLGLRLITEADAHQRGTAATAIDQQALQPGPEWAIDLIIVSDGGAAMSVGSDDMGLIDEVFRSIDIASLETGIIRPIDNSVGPPTRFLSLPGLIAPYPDSEIAIRLDPSKARQRYFFFQPEVFDDQTLKMIASLPPDSVLALAAVRDFQAGGSSPPIRDVDPLCTNVQGANNTNVDCAWWRLVTIVGSDVENAANVFRSSGTLRDDYSSAEVDALVRLGRYFVLLRWPWIEACLSAVESGASDTRRTCML